VGTSWPLRIEGRWLGNRFLDEAERAIARIKEAPERWQKSAHSTRRLGLRRFPHTVFYRIRPDALWIVAVAPHRKRPFYWRHRAHH
jgi:toxin ParE1/3/4